MKLSLFFGVVYMAWLVSLITIVFLAGCGGGSQWKQCQPCDDDCTEYVIVNTPEFGGDYQRQTDE